MSAYDSSATSTGKLTKTIDIVKANLGFAPTLNIYCEI